MKEEIDIDDAYDISAIKALIYDAEDNLFYVLANKYEERLGFFILRIQADHPVETEHG